MSVKKGGFGNQNALGNDGGRPGRDLVELAADLVQWSTLDSSTNLNGFCALRSIPPFKLSQYARENPVFRLSFDLSKAHLAQRREDYLGQGLLHVKAYDINASNYDYFLRDERRTTLEHEVKTKKDMLDTQQITLTALLELSRSGALSQK